MRLVALFAVGFAVAARASASVALSGVVEAPPRMVEESAPVVVPTVTESTETADGGATVIIQTYSDDN